MRQFTEVQRFNQWWIILIMVLSIVAGPGMYLVFSLSEKGEPFDIATLVATSAIPFFVVLIFLVLRLETKIDESGIQYKFYPSDFSFRKIEWADIAHLEMRKYKPISEYGGWGIKSSRKYGKAYNVAGDMGLQLELKNGQKILIGTQKAEEMEMVLRDLKPLRP